MVSTMRNALICAGFGGLLSALLPTCTLETAPSSLGAPGLPRAGVDVGKPAIVEEDAGSAPPSSGDGETCGEDADCESDHCDHEVCCSAGSCCLQDADCERDGRTGVSCEDPATCQGRRGVLGCEDYRCVAATGSDDDSACDKRVQASDCGPYPAVFCNGKRKQDEPPCADACSDDADCDAEAHCEDDVCVLDVPDGEDCDADADCVSDHCANGACCADGDCCKTAESCPASYASSPQCDDPSACQGTRNDASCVEHVCGSNGVEDDSACEGELADECGDYANAICIGEETQPPPECPDSCDDDSACDEDAHCDGSCVPDVPTGDSCEDDSECQTGHCQNGLCCANGDCCNTRRDCPFFYSTPPLCINRDGCEGYRREAECTFNVCWARTIPDYTACGRCEVSSRD
jgi:hypothetical protein